MLFLGGMTKGITVIYRKDDYDKVKAKIKSKAQEINCTKYYLTSWLKDR